MEELQSKIEDLGAERDTAQERVNELMSGMESNKKAMAAAQLAKDQLVLKLKVAEPEKEECINEADAAIDDKEKMIIEIEAMETKTKHTQDIIDLL